MLKEIKQLEQNPKKVLKEIKEEFIKEEFLKNVPEECRDSVQTALEMSEFNKKVILAQIP